MEVTKVFVIFDKTKYRKEDVVTELNGEGYIHEFHFSDGFLTSDTLNAISTANEVWLFGDCTDSEEYKVGLALGVDFWQMG